MQVIEKVILEFTNWSQPWTFYKSIYNHTQLDDKQRLKFEEIYKKAASIELWNHSDLNLGCKNSRIFLKNNYEMSDYAVDNIVRALSYEWR